MRSSKKKNLVSPCPEAQVGRQLRFAVQLLGGVQHELSEGFLVILSCMNMFSERSLERIGGSSIAPSLSDTMGTGYVSFPFLFMYHTFIHLSSNNVCSVSVANLIVVVSEWCVSERRRRCVKCPQVPAALQGETVSLAAEAACFLRYVVDYDMLDLVRLSASYVSLALAVTCHSEHHPSPSSLPSSFHLVSVAELCWFRGCLPQ
jgi:hypothetical protein